MKNIIVDVNRKTLSEHIWLKIPRALKEDDDRFKILEQFLKCEYLN